MSGRRVAKPKAVIGDFRTWVLSVYPQDEQIIEDIPNVILEGLYPDVRSLGPAAKITADLESVITDLYEDGGVSLISTLTDRVKGDKSSMFSTVRKIDPAVDAGRDKWVRGFVAELGVEHWRANPVLSTLGFLMSAHTVYSFPETSDWFEWSKAYAKAGVIIRSWERVHAEYCENNPKVRRSPYYEGLSDYQRSLLSVF